MKKHFRFIILALLVLVLGSAAAARAEIIPPYGEGQFGLSAVVLCEELTLRESAGTSSKAVMTLPYGSLISVVSQSGNWAYCVFGDAEDSPAGWVNADYIAIDPAWYIPGAATQVYAWNDTDAPRVALLEKGTRLPILMDNGEWLVVSLRGASGWIKK